MADPLGISTGQGQGRAQVFGDTYNDYFAEKVKTGTEEKKTQQAELAKLQSADGLWDRDNELFKPKIENIRKYYRENARKIIQGDFDATTNLEAMKNDLTQFVGSSKASKEYYIDLKKKIAADPDKYSDATKARMDEYQRTGGRFDNDISFSSKYNASDTIDNLSKKVKEAGYDLNEIEFGKDKEGKTFMIDTQGQRLDIDGLVESVLKAEDSFYGDNQVSEYWNKPGRKDEIKNVLSSLPGAKRTTKYSPPSGQAYNQGQADKKSLATVLLNDVWHVQNYIPETTEAVLDKIVESVSSLKSAVHTNSTPELKKEHPGEGGVVFTSSDSKGKISTEFIESSRYERFLKKLQNTKQYNSLKNFDLEKIKDYQPTSEEIKYRKDQKNIYNPSEVYEKNINDYSQILTNISTSDKPATMTMVESWGITAEEKNKLKALYTNGTPKSKDIINVIKKSLISKSSYIEPEKNSEGDKTGGNLVDIKIDDNELTFYFEDDKNKATVEGKYNNMTYTKKDNEGFDVSGILKKLLKKGGTKVKVEEVTLTPEQIQSVRDSNPDATKGMSDEEILQAYKSQ